MIPLAEPTPEPSSLLTRLAVGASIAVHLAAVSLSLGYAGAEIIAAPSDAIPVNLVTPEDVPEPQNPPPQEEKPEPDPGKFDLRLSPANSSPPPQSPAATQAPAKPSPQPSPQPAKQQQAAAAASPPAAQPAYTPPAPDISLRYQIDLGLKPMPATPMSTASAPGSNSDFDSPATDKADIDKTDVAAFRAHLKQCALLPTQIAPDDKVVIVLRATFTPEAKLAAAPVLIEASASAKGPALMQAAIAALQACQPFGSLPTDKYAEWRTLDLRFTPQDFRRG